MFFNQVVSFLKLIGAKIMQDAITACHVAECCAEGGRMGAEQSPVRRVVNVITTPRNYA